MKSSRAPVTKELLKWLEENFPDRLPTGDVPSRADIAHEMGKQAVIRKLRSEYDKQG